METIEIMPMVVREFKKKNYSFTQLGKKLDVDPAGIKKMLNRNSIQVKRLLELSEIFQYNFFRELAHQLPYAEPDFSDEEDTEKKELKENLKILEDRNKALEMEVGILRQTLKDVVSGGK